MVNAGTITGTIGIQANGATNVGSVITNSGTIIGTGGTAIKLSAANDTSDAAAGFADRRCHRHRGAAMTS